MTLPRSDEEWAAAFQKELSQRAQKLLAVRGEVVGGGRRLVIEHVMILEWWTYEPSAATRLSVSWWDGQRSTTVIDSAQPGLIDSDLAGSIVLPILRRVMVLDDLANV